MAILAQDLRDAVLQAALQGKLTEQLDTDSSVDNRLININKNKNIEELNFEIPSNWSYATLESFSESISSKKYQIKDSEVLKNGKFPVISQSKEHSIGFCNDKNKVLKVYSPLIIFGDHTTIIKYIDFDFVIGADGVKVFKPNSIVNAKYLYYALTYMCLNLSKMGGYTRHYKYIKNKAIPLPPIEEQSRIVIKIEELMAKIEEYEKIENRLEEIKKAFPNDMKDAILQAAMQGKLTKQLPTDSSVDDLIEQIKKERKKLEDEGKIKKTKGTKSVEFWEDENLPSNWKICSLENILYLGKGEKITNKIYNYLDAKYLRTFANPVKKDSGNFIKKNTYTILVDGENSGEVFKVPEDGYMGSTYNVLNILNVLNVNFVLYFLLFYKNYLRQNKKGSAIPHLNKSIFYSLEFPIPPIEEQQRIVKQLDKLLPLCGDLK